MSNVMLNTACLAGHRYPAMAETLRQAAPDPVDPDSATAAAPSAAKVDCSTAPELRCDLRDWVRRPRGATIY